MQTTMAEKLEQYVLLTWHTLTEFSNKNNAQELVDQLKSIAPLGPPLQLIFTCAGNIGSNFSESSTMIQHVI